MELVTCFSFFLNNNVSRRYFCTFKWTSKPNFNDIPAFYCIAVPWCSKPVPLLDCCVHPWPIQVIVWARVWQTATLKVKPCLPSVFVNKVLLAPSHAHSFLHRVWLVSATTAELSGYNTDHRAHRAGNIYSLAL